MPDVRLLTPLVRLLVAGLLVRLLVSLWVYRRRRRSFLSVTDTRFERVTFRTGI